MSPRNTISGCGMVGIYQPSFFFLRRYSARNARNRAGADEQAAAIECILSGAHGTTSSAAGGLRHAMVNSGSSVFSSRPSDSITNPSRW